MTPPKMPTHEEAEKMSMDEWAALWNLDPEEREALEAFERGEFDVVEAKKPKTTESNQRPPEPPHHHT